MKTKKNERKDRFVNEEKSNHFKLISFFGVL